MKHAFTVIELMIIISFIAIILAIIIPNFLENRKTKKGEVSIGYRDIVGKTFIWNDNKTIIADYNGDGRYVVVVLPTNGGAVNVTVDRKIIMDAYKASTHVQEEKVEQ